MAIDTLKVAKRLREAGFTEPQAEAVIAAVQEGTEGTELATRPDLAELSERQRRYLGLFIAGYRCEEIVRLTGVTYTNVLRQVVPQGLPQLGRGQGLPRSAGGPSQPGCSPMTAPISNT